MSDLQDIISSNAINSFNQGVATGERLERERIIKLLTDYSNGETLISFDVAIALIKGENK